MKLTASKPINFGGNSINTGDTIEVNEETGQHLMEKHPDWFGGVPSIVEPGPQEAPSIAQEVPQAIPEPVQEEKPAETPVNDFKYSREEIRGWSKEHQLMWLKKKGIKPALTENGRIKQILDNQ